MPPTARRRPSEARDNVNRLLGWVGATLGGALGWWAGASWSVFAAFLLSIVGTGLGLYAGRWAAARLLD
jgi:hypothetical protein